MLRMHTTDSSIENPQILKMLKFASDNIFPKNASFSTPTHPSQARTSTKNLSTKGQRAAHFLQITNNGSIQSAKVLVKKKSMSSSNVVSTYVDMAHEGKGDGNSSSEDDAPPLVVQPVDKTSRLRTKKSPSPSAVNPFVAQTKDFPISRKRLKDESSREADTERMHNLMASLRSMRVQDEHIGTHNTADNSNRTNQKQLYKNL
jgi:hypothetical protein